MIIFTTLLALQTPIQRAQDGITVRTRDAWVRLQVCGDSIVRVAAAKDPSFFLHESYVVLPGQQSAKWTLKESPTEAILATSKLQAHVDLATGKVSFTDIRGRRILSEGTRAEQPADVQGAKTFHVQQTWTPERNESLYGLGQHQLGLMDIKGYDLDLWQHNATVAVPFLVSSRGYGVLWDNLSYTRFGDLREASPISADELRDASGKPGGLTASYFGDPSFEKLVGTKTDASLAFAPSGRAANDARFPGLPLGDVSVRWEGTIVPKQSGDHTFHAFSNGGIKLWIDGKPLMDHWRQAWLPWKDVARVPMQAGKPYKIRLEWVKDQGANAFEFKWKTPSPTQATSLWSEGGEGIDYYFVYGPSLDKVVAGYRRLTGAASMMPRWAYGLWQSRQRYETQQQSLDVVDGFRKRHIPFDNIVQDWFYWRANAWGSHEFDPARFPNPQGWIDAIHARNAHLMISVWGKFYPGTANFDAMHSRGFLYEPNLTEGLKDWVNYPYTFYDAFNPAARELFWSQVDRELFKKKADAWWMDATEPDLLPTPTLEGTKTHMNPTALGPATKVLNGYALLNSKGVYEGQRKSAPDQRPFILTRSGFAGQQRYATATWSGDITSTWTALKKQIPAGLGFSISGVPYWTMDIGGFSVPFRFASRNAKPEDVDEWRELNARWFEFGTFVPLLRVHGESPYREMWEFGGETSSTYQAQLKFDRLRYRLMPYIYSLAGEATLAGGTIMRPLVMDFPDDLKARQIDDQYMFGRSLLVSPVTTYKARERSVYLPKGRWYDFWTGASLTGGHAIQAPAPYDAIPLHVRAGTILPFGPEIEYVGEKPADPITLVVYTGADGDFTLYEDDGLTNAYERGQFSQIPIHWSERDHTLTVGRCTGEFQGMPKRRTFNVAVVSARHPVPFSFDLRADRQIVYDGSKTELRFTP